MSHSAAGTPHDQPPDKPHSAAPPTLDPATAQLREQMLAFCETLPFFRLLGLEVLDMLPGSSVTRIRFRPDLCQPAGIMHGGVIATLIDTGIAHALLLSEHYQRMMAQGAQLVTVDLRIKYFRPVAEGVLVCHSSVPRLGRHIMHGESIVTNEQGKEVARGDSIFMAVHRPPRPDSTSG